MFDFFFKFPYALLEKFRKSETLMGVGVSQGKILDSVVVPDSVQVVDDFVPSERTAKVFAHHDSMFHYPVVLRANDNVPVLRNHSTALETRVAGSLETVIPVIPFFVDKLNPGPYQSGADRARMHPDLPAYLSSGKSRIVPFDKQASWNPYPVCRWASVRPTSVRHFRSIPQWPQVIQPA